MAMALALTPALVPSEAHAQFSSFGSSGSDTRPNPKPDPTPTPDPDPDPVKPQPQPPVFDTNPVNTGDLDIPTADLENIVLNPKARDASIEESKLLFGDLSSIENLVGEHPVPASIVASSRLEKGTVLSLSPTENMPGGALIVVEDINSYVNNVSTITTRQGDISDVITDTNGLVELTGMPTDVRAIAADNATMELPLIGEAAVEARPEWADGDDINDRNAIATYYSTPQSGEYNLISVPFTVDLSQQLSGVDAASISGNIESKIRTTLKTTFMGGVEQFSLSLDSRVLATADFEAGHALAAAIEKKVGDVFVTIPIPGAPVSITMKAEVNLGASAEASGSFRYTTRINARSTTGIQYKNNRIRPIQDKSLTTKESKNLSGNMSLTANFNTKASAEVNVLSVLDGGIETSGDLRASFIATVTNRNLSCVTTLDAKIGIIYTLLRASDSHTTGWVPISESGNLCSGEILEPEEPPVDLNNVVPRGFLRTCINEELGRYEDANHPISADEMASIRTVSIGSGYGFRGCSTYDTSGQVSLEGLQYATQLENLYVYEGNISVVDIPDISLLPRLKSIHINFADGAGFSSAEGDFSALTHFNITGGLRELPAELVEAPMLEALWIANAPWLSALPDSTEYSPTLEGMRIENSGITTLPESLSSATSLAAINLIDNDKLVSLPSSLGTHPTLNSLDIYEGNRFKNLPINLGSSPALHSLSLRDLPVLETVPDAIGHSPGLKYLTVEETPRLKNFPSTISSPALKSLDLRNVHLDSIPSDMSAASSLSQVDFSANNLTEVPLGVQNIPNLETLTLTNNNITRLPEFLVAMAEFGRLTRVNVHSGNPLDTADPIYQRLYDMGILS